ncbi:MAG: hypothetical protein RMK29_08930 [Myxococcales bacterium]|nr:hypothetical protein [Myxococcota bacterium]MDW8281821.1 hypothetical protein [Myxococcales bacterium]
MLRAAPSVSLLVPLLLVGPGCSSYVASLARDFGTAVTGPGADMRPMIRTLGALCLRQADLAYLRARLEDPSDQQIVPWRGRRQSLFGGRRQSIETSCNELDSELVSYQMMFDVLLAYGAALRSLGEAQNADFRQGFSIMGESLGRLAVRLRPRSPELGRIMISGADSINQLLRLALSARSERDIKRAVRAAKGPVTALLDRLERLLEVYRAQVTRYTDAQRALVDKVERATQPLRPGHAGRQLDLLAFYELAVRMDEEEQRLLSSSRAYAVTLANLRSAHETLVKSVEGKVPPREALAAVQQSLRELSLRLGEIYDQTESMIRRGDR